MFDLCIYTQHLNLELNNNNTNWMDQYMYKYLIYTYKNNSAF